MFYSTTTDTYITEGIPFSIGKIQYPANWLELSSTADKELAGLVEVITVGHREDEDYFVVTETLVGPVNTITNTPKHPDVIFQMESDNAQKQIDTLELQTLLPRTVRAYLLSVLDHTSTEYNIVKSVDDRVQILRSKLIKPHTT